MQINQKVKFNGRDYKIASIYEDIKCLEITQSGYDMTSVRFDEVVAEVVAEIIEEEEEEEEEETPKKSRRKSE